MRLSLAVAAQSQRPQLAHRSVQLLHKCEGKTLHSFTASSKIGAGVLMNLELLWRSWGGVQQTSVQTCRRQGEHVLVCFGLLRLL